MKFKWDGKEDRAHAKWARDETYWCHWFSLKSMWKAFLVSITYSVPCQVVRWLDLNNRYFPTSQFPSPPTPFSLSNSPSHSPTGSEQLGLLCSHKKNSWFFFFLNYHVHTEGTMFIIHYLYLCRWVGTYIFIIIEIRLINLYFKCWQ